ncbi:hypothetical protein TNCV_4009731 [Trichonephila clavipes]|nr:hypothetical protein TNCV_4009731 [Trichonephila clavipes]
MYVVIFVHTATKFNRLWTVSVPKRLVVPRGNAVKTRRIEQAVVSWPLPKNYSSRSYESSLDGAASECSNK